MRSDLVASFFILGGFAVSGITVCGIHSWTEYEVSFRIKEERVRLESHPLGYIKHFSWALEPAERVSSIVNSPRYF